MGKVGGEEGREWAVRKGVGFGVEDFCKVQKT